MLALTLPLLLAELPVQLAVEGVAAAVVGTGAAGGARRGLVVFRPVLLLRLRLLVMLRLPLPLPLPEDRLELPSPLLEPAFLSLFMKGLSLIVDMVMRPQDTEAQSRTKLSGLEDETTQNARV